MGERDSATSRAASAVNRVSRRTIIIAVIILVFFILIKFSFSFGRSLFYVDPAEDAPGTDMEITITADDTLETIAESLKEKGVITNTLSFVVQGTLYKIDFYPGTYTVNSSMTIRDMLLDIDEKADTLKELDESGTGTEMESTGDTGEDVGYEGDAVDGAAAEGVDIAQEETTIAESDDSSAGTEIGGGSEGD